MCYCLTGGSGKYRGRNIYLWNPSTRKSKLLDGSCFTDLLLSDCLTSVYERIYTGFVFDEPTNDYKLTVVSSSLVMKMKMVTHRYLKLRFLVLRTIHGEEEREKFHTSLDNRFDILLWSCPLVRKW